MKTGQQVKVTAQQLGGFFTERLGIRFDESITKGAVGRVVRKHPDSKNFPGWFIVKFERHDAQGCEKAGRHINDGYDLFVPIGYDHVEPMLDRDAGEYVTDTAKGWTVKVCRVCPG